MFVMDRSTLGGPVRYPAAMPPPNYVGPPVHQPPRQMPPPPYVGGFHPGFGGGTPNFQGPPQGVDPRQAIYQKILAMLQQGAIHPGAFQFLPNMQQQQPQSEWQYFNAPMQPYSQMPAARTPAQLQQMAAAFSQGRGAN